jgi:hypothetical protein
MQTSSGNKQGSQGWRIRIMSTLSLTARGAALCLQLLSLVGDCMVAYEQSHCPFEDLFYIVMRPSSIREESDYVQISDLEFLLSRDEIPDARHM